MKEKILFRANGKKIYTGGERSKRRTSQGGFTLCGVIERYPARAVLVYVQPPTRAVTGFAIFELPPVDDFQPLRPRRRTLQHDFRARHPSRAAGVGSSVAFVGGARQPIRVHQLQRYSRPFRSVGTSRPDGQGPPLPPGASRRVQVYQYAHTGGRRDERFCEEKKNQRGAYISTPQLKAPQLRLFYRPRPIESTYFPSVKTLKLR